jgi:hypothetical protein
MIYAINGAMEQMTAMAAIRTGSAGFTIGGPPPDQEAEAEAKAEH